MLAFNEYLIKNCRDKNNRLCIGLDFDNRKLKDNSVQYLEGFIKDTIEATIDLCPVYKINFSFYERLGSRGYELLNKITEIINGRAVTIADGKRGDIGNSSKYYAEAIFNTLNYDSITVSPYMGEDSILPFCSNQSKGVFILCLTSNRGSNNFQNQIINKHELYIHVSKLALDLNKKNNIGLVIGATKNDRMKKIKKYSGNLPWLIPGVGFQGGSLKDSIQIGSLNKSVPIINVSRGIIYAGNGSIKAIRDATENYTNKIRSIL